MGKKDSSHTGLQLFVKHSSYTLTLFCLHSPRRSTFGETESYRGSMNWSFKQKVDKPTWQYLSLWVQSSLHDKSMFSSFFHPPRNTGMKTQGMMPARRIIQVRAASWHPNTTTPWASQARLVHMSCCPGLLLAATNEESQGQGFQQQEDCSSVFTTIRPEQVIDPFWRREPKQRWFQGGKGLEAVAIHFLTDIREAKCSRTGKLPSY